MLFREYFDVQVIVESQKITFALSNDESGFDPDIIDEKKIRIELRTSKLFHKILNIIKEHRHLFEKEDFELLGEMLYKILFGSNNTGKLLMTKIISNELKQEGCACRIYLEFNDNSQMAVLPWEYTMFTTADGQRIYLSADKDSKHFLIRRIKQRKYKTPAVNKINLIAIFNSEDNSEEHIPPISHQEVENVLDELKQDNAGRFDWKPMVNVPEDEFMSTFSELVKSFDKIDGQIPPYMVHYFGHCMVDDYAGKLVFNSKVNGAYWLEDKKFAGYFEKAALSRNGIKNAPEIFVLQACDSAKIINYQEGSGVALALARNDIPAVIGMQNEIDVSSSTEFMLKFYESLLSGNDVAEAVTVGRDHLGKTYNFKANESGYSNNTFGSPVLFISTMEPIVLVTGEQPGAQDTHNRMNANATVFCPYCSTRLTLNDMICSNNKCRRDVSDIIEKIKNANATPLHSAKGAGAEQAKNKRSDSGRQEAATASIA